MVDIFPFEATAAIENFLKEYSTINYFSAIWDQNRGSTNTSTESPTYVVPTMEVNAVERRYGSAFQLPDPAKPMIKVTEGLNVCLFYAQLNVRLLTGASVGYKYILGDFLTIDNDVVSDATRARCAVQFPATGTYNHVSLAIPMAEITPYNQLNEGGSLLKRELGFQVRAYSDMQVTGLSLFALGFGG